MKYAKTKNNVVVQTQPNKGRGFRKVPDDVVCGMVRQKDGSFVAPPIEDTRTYKEKRALEYPNLGDQLDAIMKWVFTETEFEVPEELKSIAAKCMSVKSKYPKTKE